MQMKIKEKMIAVVMAFAMMFTFIFAGESSEVIAAAKTKALEINVDFARNAASGDDSGIYIKSLISNKKITFGKTYVFQTKIYVPAVYMKTGRIWVKPAVNFFTGKNGDTYAGMAQSSKEGYSYDKNSDKDRFDLVQNIFTVRRDHKSNSAAANITFDSTGKHLLCSNAGDNTVTIYKVDSKTGKLSSLNSLPISGDYPKYIRLFPDDKHLMSMNNEGNSITIFTVKYDKGLIIMNGPELKISRPNNMIIKELK